MVARESGFLKKIQGEGFGKSFVCKSWGRHGKQFKNVWAELGQAGRSILIFSKMTAENLMLRASHCNQIYCGLLRELSDYGFLRQ